MKSIIILFKHIKVDSTSNDFIQTIYLGLNEDETLKDKHFTNKCSLFIQNCDFDNLNKCTIEFFFGISGVYLNANIAVMKDGTNNGNYYSTKYLNSLSPFKSLSLYF